MTKKKKIAPVRKYESVTFNVQETVLKVPAKTMPINLTEEKEKFLTSGKTPSFVIHDRIKLTEQAGKMRNRIRFELQGEAEYILEKVRHTYGDGEAFLEHVFGPRISKTEATPMILKYLSENALSESIQIHWCDNMPCSAKMMWTGPMVNMNRPDLRKYSLWINGSDENNYMRESGIICLLDHEIGTHFFRMFNDGLQPWFSDRSKFGLRGLSSFELQCSEEGFAAVNTVLRGRVRFLWSAALAYYTACKAAEMTFKELFDHLGHYTSNRDYRWKQVMRVKRGLDNPNDLGGFGNDQCYFEGAVKVLRQASEIDFHLFMAGKICLDEVDRIKRVARRELIKIPSFLKTIHTYRQTLKKMASLNGLQKTHPIRSPPSAYVNLLKNQKSKGRSTKKVRQGRLSKLAKLKSSSREKSKSQPDVEMLDFTENKNTEMESLVDVDIFCPNSNDDINEKFDANKEEEEDENEEDECHKVHIMSTSINHLDKILDKQIEHLHGIVRDHTWYSDDAGYRQSVMSEISFGDNKDDDDNVDAFDTECDVMYDEETASDTMSNSPKIIASQDLSSSNQNHKEKSLAYFENGCATPIEKVTVLGDCVQSDLKMCVSCSQKNTCELPQNFRTKSSLAVLTHQPCEGQCKQCVLQQIRNNRMRAKWKSTKQYATEEEECFQLNDTSYDKSQNFSMINMRSSSQMSSMSCYDERVHSSKSRFDNFPRLLPRSNKDYQSQFSLNEIGQIHNLDADGTDDNMDQCTMESNFTTKPYKEATPRHSNLVPDSSRYSPPHNCDSSSNSLQHHRPRSVKFKNRAPIWFPGSDSSRNDLGRSVKHLNALDNECFKKLDSNTSNKNVHSDRDTPFRLKIRNGSNVKGQMAVNLKHKIPLRQPFPVKELISYDLNSNQASLRSLV